MHSNYIFNFFKLLNLVSAKEVIPKNFISSKKVFLTLTTGIDRKSSQRFKHSMITNYNSIIALSGTLSLYCSWFDS